MFNYFQPDQPVLGPPMVDLMHQSKMRAPDRNPRSHISDVPYAPHRVTEADSMYGMTMPNASTIPGTDRRTATMSKRSQRSQLRDQVRSKCANTDVVSNVRNTTNPDTNPGIQPPSEGTPLLPTSEMSTDPR